MFPIAGQTAGPIGLNFFVDTHGWPGGVLYFKKSKSIYFNVKQLAHNVFKEMFESDTCHYSNIGSLEITLESLLQSFYLK